jgi:hypothetical protein
MFGRDDDLELPPGAYVMTPPGADDDDGSPCALARKLTLAVDLWTQGQRRTAARLFESVCEGLVLARQTNDARQLIAATIAAGIISAEGLPICSDGAEQVVTAAARLADRLLAELAR